MKRPSEILNHSSQPTGPSAADPNSVTLINVPTRRGRLPENTVHQIPDYELTLLVKLAAESSYLTIGIALLFLPTGFVVALLTATMSHQLQLILTGLAAGSFCAGAALCIVWLRMRRLTQELAAKIQSRLDE